MVAVEAWADRTPTGESLLPAKTYCSIWFRFLLAFTDLGMTNHNPLHMTFDQKLRQTSFSIYHFPKLPLKAGTQTTVRFSGAHFANLMLNCFTNSEDLNDAAAKGGNILLAGYFTTAGTYQSSKTMKKKHTEKQTGFSLGFARFILLNVLLTFLDALPGARFWFLILRPGFGASKNPV